MCCISSGDANGFPIALDHLDHLDHRRDRQRARARESERARERERERERARERCRTTPCREPCRPCLHIQGGAASCCAGAACCAARLCAAVLRAGLPARRTAAVTPPLCVGSADQRRLTGTQGPATVPGPAARCPVLHWRCWHGPIGSWAAGRERWRGSARLLGERARRFVAWGARPCCRLSHTRRCQVAAACGVSSCRGASARGSGADEAGWHPLGDGRHDGEPNCGPAGFLLRLSSRAACR